MVIQTRIFLGYLQNKEIKTYLNQSKRWKEAKNLTPTDLVETSWQEKEYIGKFIPSLLTYTQIKEIEEKIKAHLQFYCPKLNLDKYSAQLLSQLFIC